MTSQNTPSILKLKNTAHIIKTTMEFGFAIAAILMAGTAIYTASKGVALSSALPAFFANPWVIAAIAIVAAAYLIATAISSYQQLSSIEGAKGQDGKNGRDANFSDLLGDAVIGDVKDGEIVEEGGKLYLKLSSDKYQALVSKDKAQNTQVSLHMLSMKDGKVDVIEVQFKHVDTPNDNGNYKVALTSHTDKKDLRMDDNATSLTAAVSNKNHEALKGDVSAKLADVAIEGAIKKSTAKAA